MAPETNQQSSSSGKDKEPKLARGLQSLMGDSSIAAAVGDSSETENSTHLKDSESIKKIPIEFIRPNPNNPRRKFPNEELGDLATSIRVKGIFQPILVRPVPDKIDRYEIIAGERRWRAAQMAKIHEIPAVIREVDDKEALELAIIENVQRTDLNPIEEASGYDALISNHSITQDELGKAIGKSRSHIANTLRLLKLPDSVKEQLMQGKLSAGHARTLITTDKPAQLAEKIVSEGLNVREAEKLANESSLDKEPEIDQSEPDQSKPVQPGPSQPKPEQPKYSEDPDTKALEKSLSDSLGLEVAITSNESGKGEMLIKFATLEQLEHICKILGQES